MTDKPKPQKPQLIKIKAVPDSGGSQRGSAHITYLDLPPEGVSIDPPKATTESTGESKQD